MDVLVNLGFMIRSKRDEKDIKLSDLPRRVFQHGGGEVSVDILSAIEQGTAAPNRQTIKGLAGALDIDEQELVRAAQAWNTARRKDVKTVFTIVKAPKVDDDGTPDVA